MKNLLLSAFCGALISLHPATSYAGARSYLSRTGSDTLPGGATNQCGNQISPCVTFGRAISAAGTDGEVICLDSGFFGAINITVPIAIRCDQHIGQTGINFNTVNLSTDGIVVLDGIDIDLRDTPGATSVALAFTGRGTLILRNTSIRNGEIGLRFAPNGNAKLVIENTNFESHTGVGVLIEPQAAGMFQIDMDNVKSTNNFGGVASFASAGETILLEIRNSLLAQNSNYGFYSRTDGGTSIALIDNVSASNNANVGIYSKGANSVVLVNRSVLARNSTGWAFAAGGALLTYRNNAVNSITAAGGPSGIVSLQ